jgi:hypothetical protein
LFFEELLRTLPKLEVQNVVNGAGGQSEQVEGLAGGKVPTGGGVRGEQGAFAESNDGLLGVWGQGPKRCPGR